MNNFIRKYINFSGPNIFENNEGLETQKQKSENTNKFSCEVDSVIRKEFKENEDYDKKGLLSTNVKDLVFQENDEEDQINSFKDFLRTGNKEILNKAYNGQAMFTDNTIILPTLISEYFLHKKQDLTIFQNINIIQTKAHSLAIPIRNLEKQSFFWSGYGEDVKEDDGSSFDFKILKLGTLSTCHSVSRDFMNNNSKFADWIMETATEDFNSAICKAILRKEGEENQYIEGIFNICEQIDFVKNEEKEEGALLKFLQSITDSLEAPYRKGAAFYMSREFFNELTQEIAENKYLYANFVYQKEKTFLGYKYFIIDQIEGKNCLFGDLKAAYCLVENINPYFERDSITKKTFTKFFFAQFVAGAVVDKDAIRWVSINSQKEEKSLLSKEKFLLSTTSKEKVFLEE